MVSIGQNVQYEVKNNKLMIEVDLNAKTTPSASGKSQVIASTRGNSHLTGIDVKLGLNLYKQ